MYYEDELLSYFEFYKDEDMDEDFAWWYCLTNARIYETSELYSQFRYSSKEEIYASNVFVEFTKVDIIELKKKYLLIKRDKDEYISWIYLEEREFDIQFNKYIDVNNIIKEWYEFEREALKEAFKKWCLINNLYFK